MTRLSFLGFSLRPATSQPVQGGSVLPKTLIDIPMPRVTPAPPAPKPKTAGG